MDTPHLSIEEIQDFIRHSAGELRRVRQLKAESDSFNPLLEAEIRLWEDAHDMHWQLYNDRTSQTGAAG